MKHLGSRTIAVFLSIVITSIRLQAQQPGSAPPQPEEITIGVVVLNELPAGHEISGRVVENPAKYEDIPGLRVVTAKVPKQSAGGSTATLSGVVVDVGDGRKQPADKPLRWVPPVVQTAMMISVLLRDQPSRPIAQETVPVVREPANGATAGSQPTETGGGKTTKPETTKPETTKPETIKPETTKPETTKPETKRPTRTKPETPTRQPVPTGGSEVEKSHPSEVTMPITATQGGVHVIHGNPSGNSEAMTISVDGTPALIVAAKPGAVFWELPESIPAGEHVVHFIPGPGMPPVTMPIYVIGFGMSADRTNLLRGQSTRMRVTITGLDKLPATVWEEMGIPPSDLVNLKHQEERVPGFHVPTSADKGTILLVLVNRSPSTVTMGKGNVVVLQLHKKDFASGTYTYEDKIQSLVSGTFSISGTLTSFLRETSAPVVSR